MHIPPEAQKKTVKVLLYYWKIKQYLIVSIGVVNRLYRHNYVFHNSFENINIFNFPKLIIFVRTDFIQCHVSDLYFCTCISLLQVHKV